MFFGAIPCVAFLQIDLTAAEGAYDINIETRIRQRISARGYGRCSQSSKLLFHISITSFSSLMVVISQRAA